MAWLVWAGAALAFLGVLGLFWCAFMAMQARRDAADEAALRKRLQLLVAYNLGSLAIAALGLMILIVGLFLR
ncbi:MAG: hypothetical protein AAF771_06945 [Pseudomonadota bacterium]